MRLFGFLMALVLASVMMSNTNRVAAQCIMKRTIGPPSECLRADFSGLRATFYFYQGQYNRTKALNKQQYESAKSSCNSGYLGCKASVERDMAAFRGCVRAHDGCIASAQADFASANALAEDTLEFEGEHLADMASRGCAKHTCCTGSQQCMSTGLFGKCVCPCCP